MKTLVNFHIGRGGRFNNQGHLTYTGTGTTVKDYIREKSFLRYENEDSITRQIAEENDMDIDNVRDEFNQCEIGEFCEKYTIAKADFGELRLFEDTGHDLGEYSEGDEPYHYDSDGEYRTDYGKQIECFEDLTDREQEAVRQSKYGMEELERAGVAMPQEIDDYNEEDE